MAKDGTNRGGPRANAGRKPKALKEKLDTGNPGGRKLTVIDLKGGESQLDGVVMPEVKDYLTATQKDGGKTHAEEVFKDTWEWLHRCGCERLVSPQLIEQYAMAVARWIQCEEAISSYGFLAKRANGSLTGSPYVSMSREYMKQSNALWFSLYQIVKENCSVEVGGATPQDSVMEMLLRARSPK